MDWIRSPLDVPVPIHRDASPEDPLGFSGRTRVASASRMKELSGTGPVLKAGPIAASTAWMAISESAAGNTVPLSILVKVMSVVEVVLIDHLVSYR